MVSLLLKSLLAGFVKFFVTSLVIFNKNFINTCTKLLFHRCTDVKHLQQFIMITTQKIITNYRRAGRELWQTWMAGDATNEKIIKRIAAFNVWVEIGTKASILKAARYWNVLSSGSTRFNKLVYFLLMFIVADLRFRVCAFWQQAMSLSCELHLHVRSYVIRITVVQILPTSLSYLVLYINGIHYLVNMFVE